MDAPVWLALTEDGQIVSANAAAGHLWSRTPESLVGRPFVTLFSFEVVSDDPELLDSQWEVILSTAVEQRLPLTIQLHPEAPPLDVRIELEAAVAKGFSWIAHIHRGAAAGRRPDDGNEAPSTLRPDRGAVGLARFR